MRLGMRWIRGFFKSPSEEELALHQFLCQPWAVTIEGSSPITRINEYTAVVRGQEEALSNTIRQASVSRIPKQARTGMAAGTTTFLSIMGFGASQQAFRAFLRSPFTVSRGHRAQPHRILKSTTYVRIYLRSLEPGNADKIYLPRPFGCFPLHHLFSK